MPSLLIVLFILAIFIPIEFHYQLGSLRVEPYRIVLGFALIFAILNIKYILKRADSIDIFLALLIGISFISFLVNHDLQKAFESTGIYAIETLGAFYLARLWITTPKRFYYVNIGFISLLVLLFAFSIYESFAHHRILHDWARMITGNDSLDPRLYTHYYERLGILRATNVFAHPILYGTIAAMFFPFMVGLLFFSYKKRYLLATGILFSSMLLTLSSAPLLSLISQAATAIITRFWHQAQRFWLGIATIAISLAVLIESVSNRGFFGVLVSYLTFNPITGYYRMLQWQYGTDDVIQNPLLGIAHHDWTRPLWLDSSIDSFWLLLFMQHGVFAGIILLFASLLIVVQYLNRLHHYHSHIRWMVSAWILAFTAMIFIGFTVDFYGKLQPMFFFLLGAIAWAKHPDTLNHAMHNFLQKSASSKTMKQ